MTDKLLPCPFCGDEYKPHIEGHVKVTETARSGPRYGVRCYTCGGSISFFDTEAEAIAAWNTRAERMPYTHDELLEEMRAINDEWAHERTCRIETHDSLQDDPIDGDVWLECSACHWQMDYADAPTMPLNYCPNCGAKVVTE